MGPSLINEDEAQLEIHHSRFYSRKPRYMTTKAEKLNLDFYLSAASPFCCAPAARLSQFTEKQLEKS
jgi:hypothetical protein